MAYLSLSNRLGRLLDNLECLQTCTDTHNICHLTNYTNYPFATFRTFCFNGGGINKKLAGFYSYFTKSVDMDPSIHLVHIGNTTNIPTTSPVNTFILNCLLTITTH